MTRRNIRKRIRDLDSAGTTQEWPEAIEIVGVPATEINEDRRSVEDDTDDEDGANVEGDDTEDPNGDEADDGEFIIRIPIPPNQEVDDRANETPVDCPSEGCPNTVAPPLETCEACAGMPSRDWREETSDPEAINYE